MGVRATPSAISAEAVAVATAAAPTYVEGEGNPLSVTLAGSLRTTGGGGGGGTVDQGAPNTLVNGWPVKITDGTDLALVTAAGELIVGFASAQSVDVTDEPARDLGRVRIFDGTDVALVTAAGELLVSFATAQSVDVTDRDARLLGRVKTLDSAGVVIDPLNEVQLPAALVGGRLDVNIGASGITVPVSIAASVTVVGPAADGIAVSGNPVRIAGKDGGGLTQDLLTGSDGRADVNLGQVGGTTVVTAGVAGSQAVGGNLAHDAALTGSVNPVIAAMMTETPADSAPANRVSAEGDVARAAGNPDGCQFVLPYGPQLWSYHENSSSALTDASVHAAPGVGLSLYVTDIIVSTGSATAFNIFFEEGASTVLGPFYLEAVSGRGFAIHFSTPKKITANTALTVTTSAAIAHSIEVLGYTSLG